MREFATSTAPLPGHGGTLVTVGYEHDLTVHSAWGGAGRVVLAVNAYGPRHPYDGYDTCYLTVTPLGVADVQREDLGVNPRIFCGPDGAPWARLSLLTEGQDREPDTLLPLHGRETWGDPVRTPEFPGDFVGWIGSRAFWHLDDIFDDRRPARIQAADVDAGRIRVRRPVKLPLPQSQVAVLCAEGHHLAVLGQISEQAAVLRILTPKLTVEREVQVGTPGEMAFLQPVRVQADGRATLLSVDGAGRVALVRLDGQGSQQAVVVGELSGRPFAVTGSTSGTARSDWSGSAQTGWTRSSPPQCRWTPAGTPWWSTRRVTHAPSPSSSPPEVCRLRYRPAERRATISQPRARRSPLVLSPEHTGLCARVLADGTNREVGSLRSSLSDRSTALAWGYVSSESPAVGAGGWIVTPTGHIDEVWAVRTAFVVSADGKGERASKRAHRRPVTFDARSADGGGDLLIGD